MSQNSLFFDALPSNGPVLAGFSRSMEKNPYNLALHVKDDAERVIENRKELCHQLNIPFEAYTCAEQVHGCRITPVSSLQRGFGRLTQENVIPQSDALITNEPGIMLNIFVADCVPIILYDKGTASGGVCHAGWRGTSQNILLKTVKAMMECYGSNPSQITALIGPSIGQCCYQVGENVKTAFQENFRYDPCPFVVRKNNLYCDLKSANRSQLLSAGLKAERIHTAVECTYCGKEGFSSYRKSGEQAGRFSAFFYLKNNKSIY